MLAPDEYHEIKERHTELISKYPLINAVTSNIQDGFVYADSARDSFFVSTKSGFSLFNTAKSNGGFFEFLVQEKEIPNYIHLYSPERSFREFVEANWDKHKIRERAQFRNLYTNITNNYESLLPSGYQIATINEVGFDRLERVFQLNFGSRYWNSKEEFLDRAIGACILNEQGEPAAICYSACVVDGIAEMDTLVMPEYRGQHFMRIVSEPFFNIAVENKLVPHWDTFIANSASYVMAQKFQLKLIQEYDLMSLLLR